MNDMGSSSNKAAHRVVYSPDLLSLIFGYFRPPLVDPRKDFEYGLLVLEYEWCCGILYRLATTCKAFRDPAIAILWRRVVNLGHFLELFPGWTDLGDDEVYIITEDVTEDHWARIRYYAGFVRVIHDTYPTSIHPYTWSVLTRWCGREPLFPHLESLTRLRLSARSWSPLCLLSPALRHLDILLVDAPQHEDAVVGNLLLHEMTTLCPNLTTLHIESGMRAATPSLNMIHRLVNLRSLTVRKMFLQLPELQILGRFPHVETLSGTISILDESEGSRADDETSEAGMDEKAEDWEDEGEGDDEDVDGDDEEGHQLGGDSAEIKPGSSHALTATRPMGFFPPGSFSALKTLHVDGRPEDLKVFLQESLNTPLETLSVNVTIPTRPKKIRSLFVAIASYSPDTLRAFSFKYEEELGEEPGRLMDMVRPLLSLSQLKSVELNVVDLLDFSDEDVLDIANAWPILEAFRLPVGKVPLRTMMHPDRERPTHRALIYFAMNCPNLKTLVLPDIEFGCAPVAVPLAKHGLKYLSVAAKDRTPVYPLEIAMIIELLFPYLDLESIRVPPIPPPPLYQDSWSRRWYDKDNHYWPEIKRFLDSIRAGRERGESLAG
ncbi:hypothetical protein GY45DRAFT_328508 [Cubamyces sp. BRFM 1775]|nr:hypothetical protein GY45DRAFT_328508 [Cubamyces sp. BRFM 1775]